MKNLFVQILIGTAIFAAVMLVFFASQKTNAQNKVMPLKAHQRIVDSLNQQQMHELYEKDMQRVEQHLGDIQKYVEGEQENLNFWLTALSALLAIALAATVLLSIRIRETAKVELNEMKAEFALMKTDMKDRREEIRRIENDVEDRLKATQKQLADMEESGKRIKGVEDEAKKSLDEISNLKPEDLLSEKQSKRIDEIISTSKEDLENSGIEALKNLYQAKGLKANSEQKWKDSIRLFTSYIDLDDTKKRAFFNRAYAHRELGQIDAALEDYTKVIEIDPTYSNAYSNRGNIYFDKEEIEKAVFDFDKAIEYDVKNDAAWVGRGNIHYHQNDYPSAIFSYNKAASISSPDGHVYYNLYLCYNHLGQEKEAKENLNKAKELNSKEYGHMTI